ncbi:hypothetical protein VNI00_015181 [Paramarasmius palmivorus]|uniref:Uncharacterized protein n=1 Tax=Paramarasmius palmivorus TaxID=297713 RepID=A0AAW0BMY9_9AGAR
MVHLTQSQGYVVYTAWEFLIYGVYAVLFGICIRILFRRKGKAYKYHLFAIVILFLLASADVVLYMVQDLNNLSVSSLSESFRPHEIEWEPITTMIQITFLCSAVADAILLWRFYMVWGRRWRIAIVPLILDFCVHGWAPLRFSDRSLILAVVSFVVTSGSTQLVPLHVAAIAAGIVSLNNIILSTLIAFQICSIGHQIEHYLGSRSRNMYRTALSATLESGVVYSTFLIGIAAIYIDLIRRDPSLLKGDEDYPHIYALEFLLRAWPCVSGITSTIIIVRVALGISFNDVESAISSLRADGTIPMHEEQRSPQPLGNVDQQMETPELRASDSVIDVNRGKGHSIDHESEDIGIAK